MEGLTAMTNFGKLDFVLPELESPAPLSKGRGSEVGHLVEQEPDNRHFTAVTVSVNSVTSQVTNLCKSYSTALRAVNSGPLIQDYGFRALKPDLAVGQTETCNGGPSGFSIPKPPQPWGSLIQAKLTGQTSKPYLALGGLGSRIQDESQRSLDKIDESLAAPKCLMGINLERVGLPKGMGCAVE